MGITKALGLGNGKSDSHAHLKLERLEPRLLLDGAPGVVADHGALGLSGPFEDVTAQVGLSSLNHACPAAWGDYDNDGWVDLHTLEGIWHNDGGTFTKTMGLTEGGAGLWGDYDNDGYLDVFNWTGGARLLHNEESIPPGNRYLEIAQDIMPELPMPATRAAAWGDFDGDSYIDLYVGGYETWGVGNYQDVIYHNDAGASFSIVWQSPEYLPARGITACDFDEDGDLDIYVSNYRLVANILWQNDGAGNFTNVAVDYGVAGDDQLGAFGHTIGSCWGDLDNDGDFDLFVGNFRHPEWYQDYSKFYENLGAGGSFHFQDRSAGAGLAWQESYATPTLGDFDNDGYLDLFFTAVYSGDHSVLYRNNGNWTFTDVTGEAGIPATQTSNYEAAWADYDNDGDLDLLTDGKLFRNPGNSNHYLKVHLVGDGVNVNGAAIGAQVRVALGGQTITRQVESSTGEGNENDLTLHFGLGDNSGPVDVEVRWPDGTVRNLTTDVDRLIDIVWQPPGVPPEIELEDPAAGARVNGGDVCTIRWTDSGPGRRCSDRSLLGYRH